MVPGDDSPLYDLLAAWDQARRDGRPLLPEQLCADRPDLLPELKAAIDGLTATAWMDHSAADCEDIISEPTVLGEYEVHERVGAGGMGVVYRATHRRMARTVAIKVLPPRFAADPSAVNRFQAEVWVAARLIHPHVVHAYDAGEQEGVVYLVTEYVEGTDLAALVRRHGPLPLARAVEYVRQAASGLEYAHGQGVVHRDVKPSNLLLAANGGVKVADLGLAAWRGELPDASATSHVAGTVEYMAPEQADPTAQVDHRADVYALGATLYFLLTGHPVFPAETVLTTLKGHQHPVVPSLRDARPDVPLALNILVQKMLARRPEDRIQSLAEVVKALDRVARTQRKAWRWAGAFVLAGLGVAGVSVWTKSTSRIAGLTPGRSEPATSAPESTRSRPPITDDAPDEDYRATVHVGRVRTLAFGRAGNELFSGGDDGQVVWHDLTTRTVYRTMSQPPAVTAVAVAGPRLLVGTANGQVRIWQLDGPQPKEVHGFVRHKGAVTVLATSADGMFAVSGDGEEAHIWTLTGPPKTGPLPQTAGPVLAAHFLADRPEFATAVGRGGNLPTEVWRWKLSTTNESVKEYHANGVVRPKESTGAAFAVNDRVMLAAAEIKVFGWAFGSGQSVGVYEGHKKPVRHLRLAASADLAVSTDDTEVHVWNTKLMTRRWKGTRPGITAIGASGDGRRVAIGTDAGDVWVFVVGE